MNLIDLSIKRPLFVTMITLFLVVVGLLALRKLPIDLYPDVSPPVLTVRVGFPGASPEEVEELVVKRLEDVLSTIGGIKAMRSASRESMGFVSLEFEAGRDIRQEENQVRAKVAEARRSLPEDIQEPTVNRQSIDETPIIELVLTGPRSVSELSDLAENTVAQTLRQVEGVGEVSLSGERKREVRVELLMERLSKFKLNATEIVARLRGAVSQEPAGKLEGKDRIWLLRMQPSAVRSSDLENLVVARTAEGFAVRLSEVALVSESFNRASRVNRYFDGERTAPSVGLEITRQSGQNTLDVASRVRVRLQELHGQLPADVQVLVTSDASGLIKVNVADVVETLLIAAVLTVVVVLLFLQSPRSTLTTAISLPSSVLTTFFAMQAAGFTINTMTLLALSLAIGIIVDDAIVVRENIYRHLSEFKKDGATAASDGTKEVALAVVATTLTLVAVFVPVASLQSVTGQFFKPFALTVAFAVLISLWDALTMAPMLSAHFANIPSPELEWAKWGPPGRFIYRGLAKLEHGFDALARLFEGLVRRLLRQHFLVFIGLSLSIFAVWWGGVNVRKGFLPSQLGTEFRIVMDGPLSIPPERVVELLPHVEKRLAETATLESFSMSAGTGFAGNAFIQVAAKVKKDLGKNQEKLGEIRQKIRQALAGIPGYTVRISEVSDPLAGGGGRFAPIVISISGNDLRDLNILALKVREEMESIKGLSDISNLAEEGLSEFRVAIDESKAGLLGVLPSLVAENLQVWIQGQNALFLKEGDTQVPVKVSLKDGLFLSPQAILQSEIFVNTSKGREGIPLSAISSLKSAAGPTLIARENRQRTLRVSSGLAPGVALGDVVPLLEEKISGIVLPQGALVKVTGQGEQMNAFFAELGFALLLGCVFVYMVLTSLFESLIHPFTVMMAIPLAGSGALIALWMFDVPLDLYGGIGLVLLSGLVAKNSILLVDMAISIRNESPEISPAEAMARTAPKRLRPILMTSIAMIVGMLPIATGWGVGGATRQSLGIATVGGVISSTLLSLIFIPSLFVWMEKIVGLLRKVMGKPVKTAEVVKN
jgi:HAE1 family hydrophobic/amphiphilic exporter-1